MRIWLAKGTGKNGRWAPIILVASIGLIWGGFWLRLHHLGSDSLWLDELLTVEVVEYGRVSIFTQKDHPPFLYLVTALSIAGLAGGPTVGDLIEFAARLPSLLAGTLAIPIIVRLGRQIRQPGAGLWAGLLLVLSPFHVRYSQEARHYALLMTLSLLAYLLLVAGMQRPRWRTWLAYVAVTALNLYTHYGALMVLATQGLLILAWLARDGRRRWSYPLGAAALLLLAYGAWFPRLWLALTRNVGTDRISGTGGSTSLASWLLTVAEAFALAPGRWAVLMTALCLIGLLLWSQQAERMGWRLTAVALFVPLLLVVILQISRGALPRYVIYTLPFYLLAVAMAIATLLGYVSGRRRILAGTAAVVIYTAVALPQVHAEHAFVLRDWRGVVNYLDEMAEDGAMIMTLSLDHPTGYNVVARSLPFYLPESSKQFRVYGQEAIDPAELAETAAAPGKVWAVISYSDAPSISETLAARIRPFATDLYVVDWRDPSTTPLEQALAIYETYAPLATTALAQCQLWQDLAALYIAAAAYSPAEDTLASMDRQCQEFSPGRQQELEVQLYRRQLADSLAHGEDDLALAAATALRQYDQQDKTALSVLLVADLLRTLANGQVETALNGAPEPVELRRFVMPQNGEWEEVVFMHPPAAVTFDLNLPAEPVALIARLAMDPQSWGWGGDGAVFVVRAQAGAGSPVELLRYAVGMAPADRRWHDVTVPLAQFAGQSLRLTLATESGPDGNSIGDWAGWGAPRLIRWLESG